MAAGLINEEPEASPESQLNRLAVLCHQLPQPIREALVDFRLSASPAGGFVISGLPIEEGDLGPTPDGVTQGTPSRELSCTDAMLLMLASALGDPFSHAGVQDGRLILDICPVRGHEETQLASSSAGGLEWHNEDAYHEFRADWLLLMCLRNPTLVPTTFARVDDIALTAPWAHVLFEKRFLIAPDS